MMDAVPCPPEHPIRDPRVRPPGQGRPRLASLLLLVGLAGGCGQQSGIAGPVVDYEGPIAEVPVQPQAPDMVLKAIEASDLLVTPDAVLHVVWRARTKDPERPWDTTDRLYHRAGAELGRRWGRLTELGQVRGGAVRVLRLGAAVHVLAGPELRHFVSADDGASWRELSPLLAEGARPSVGFTALASGQGLLVASLSRSPRRGLPAGADGETRLNLLEWREAGPVLHRLTLSLPASLADPPAPALGSSGAALSLAVAVNAALRETLQTPRGAVEQVRSQAQIRYLESADAGATWSAPAVIVPADGADARGDPSRVEALALGNADGQRLLLFSGYGVYGLHSPDGRRWSAPRALADYATSFSEGTAESGPLALARLPGGGHAVAWVDARFRKSDRRWWNPLGGFPWADDSLYWRNNDVFLARLPDVERDPTVGGLRPGRLTRSPAYARTVGLRALPDRLIVLWAGRSRVGRALDSFDAPPALFYAVVDLS